MPSRCNLLLMTIVLIGTLGCIALAVRHSRVPAVSFDHLSVDFGESSPGEQLERIFRISNTGRAPLRISRVSSTCDCSTTTLSRDELAPGESAELKAIVKVRKFSYSTIAKVAVHTNDPKRPVTILSLEARVSPRFELLPSHIDFGSVPYGTPRALELRVLSSMELSALTAEVADVGMPTPVEVELVTVEDSSRLRVRLSEYAPVGRLSARVVLSLPPNAAETKTGAGENLRTVPVLGQVVGPIRASPSELILTGGQEHVACLGTVAVICNDGGPAPALKECKISDNLLGIIDPRITTRDDVQLVTLSLNPDRIASTTPMIRGAIRIRSDVGERSYWVQVPIQLFLHSFDEVPSN